MLKTPSDELTYEHVPCLKYTLAVFLETLRLYPSVVLIPKYSVENTVVPLREHPTNDGVGNPRQSKSLLIPKCAEVMLDVPALHYHPLYWGEDASTFRPSRFLDDEKTGYRWPRNAFMAFSQGARQCLGQKFAQVEAVTVISEIIRRYEISIDPGVLRAGESIEDARKRLLDACKTVITLTPKSFPVIFKERPRR